MLVPSEGISSFAHEIRGRNLVVWSDNTAAEATTRKGAAKSFDHTCLVHGIWLRAAELRTQLHVERVPTEVNVADDPSRERSRTPRISRGGLLCSLICDWYGLIEAIARKIPAMRVEPVLDDVFLKTQTWESLSVARIFK